MIIMVSTEKITSIFAEYSLIEDGIILVKFIADTEVTVVEAKDILMNTLRLSENKKHALLYDFNSKNVIFSGLAKSMAESRNEEDDKLYARAFVLYNISNKIEISHFLKFHKPTAATKVFNKLDEALNWVKEHRVLSHQSD